MFWKFNLLTSHLDSMLDREDLTLHEILDEDDVLQECRAQNQRLLDFLVRSDNVEELVNFITQEPSDETDEKIRYKYPNTACELLTSDVGLITDKVAGDEALMNKVYGFLEGEGPLNPLLASFFSKVMGLLITRKSEMMLEFLQGKDDFVGHLLRHLGTSAIMDLLLRLITCIENTQCHMKCLQWLSEKQLIQRLIAMIDPSQPEEKHCNASQSICDIIRLSREQMAQLQENARPDPLLASIESRETITDLLNHMFDAERSESVLVNGISIIQTLLEFKRLGPDGGTEAITSLDIERLAHGVDNTVQAISPRLKDFHMILKEPPKQHYLPMPTTVGTLNPPFGNTRLQTTKLMTSLLLTKTAAINEELANQGTIGILIDLCFQYMWNNFLHVQVEQCLSTVLSTGGSPQPEGAEGQTPTENPMLNQLLKDINIVERVLTVWEENEHQQSQQGGHRRGYMGHLTKMANHIVINMEKGCNSEQLKSHFQDLPADVRERWETFVSGSLADTNKQNTVELAGGQNLYSSSEDDDPDFRDIPFPQDTAMQQAFSDYQLQQMTSNFIDQFGFNDADFAEVEERASEKFKEKISSINFDINTDEITTAAALFEQTCSEHIQQFDDGETDEDLWEEKEITFSQTSGATGPLVPPTATPDSDDDEDSDDDDQDSPLTIHQTPASSAPQVISADSTGDATATTTTGATTATEKMDVDSGENWAHFDDVSMDTAPSSSDAAPTSSTPSWPEETSDVTTTTTATTPPTPDSWADFSNLSSTAPGPDGTAPVAMETSEDSGSTRTASYLVSSAPADLATAVSEVSQSPQQTPESTSEASSTTDAPSSPATMSPDTTSDMSSSVIPGNDTSENAKLESSPSNVESTSSPTSLSTSDLSISDLTTPEPSTPEPSTPEPSTSNPSTSDPSSSDPSEGTAMEQGEEADNPLEDEGKEEDLGENFKFLAASGLMKCNNQSESSSTTQGPTSDGAAVSSPDKLEESRAQAKEALKEFSDATSTTTSESATPPATPPPAHNGPV